MLCQIHKIHRTNLFKRGIRNDKSFIFLRNVNFVKKNKNILISFPKTLHLKFQNNIIIFTKQKYLFERICVFYNAYISGCLKLVWFKRKRLV